MIPKFRAWFSEAGQMITDDLESINFFDEMVTITSSYYDSFVDDYILVSMEVDIGNAILMQSTGSKDVNGVEIYEGDIFEYPYLDKTVAVVKMVDGCWVLDEKGLDTEFEYLYPESEIGKVIGNIYENAELLKGE